MDKQMIVDIENFTTGKICEIPLKCSCCRITDMWDVYTASKLYGNQRKYGWCDIKEKAPI